jgi:hypothetical protein
MATRSSKKSRKISLDFTGVNLEGGGSFHIPEGQYAMEVAEVEEGVSKNDNEQLEWKFRGTEGKAKGKIFYYYTTLTPESLWKLGLTLQALGVEVPDSATDVDLDDLVGKECMGTVIDDEYQGKTKSKLTEIAPLEGERDEPAQTHRASSRKGNGVKIDETEVKNMAEDELADLIDKHDLDVELRSHKTLRRKADAVISALDDKGMLA